MFNVGVFAFDIFSSQMRQHSLITAHSFGAKFNSGISNGMDLNSTGWLDCGHTSDDNNFALFAFLNSICTIWTRYLHNIWNVCDLLAFAISVIERRLITSGLHCFPFLALFCLRVVNILDCSKLLQFSAIGWIRMHRFCREYHWSAELRCRFPSRWSGEWGASHAVELLFRFADFEDLKSFIFYLYFNSKLEFQRLYRGTKSFSR